MSFHKVKFMAYTIIIGAVFSSNNALSCDESYISFMYELIEEKKMN